MPRRKEWEGDLGVPWLYEVEVERRLVKVDIAPTTPSAAIL